MGGSLINNSCLIGDSLFLTAGLLVCGCCVQAWLHICVLCSVSLPYLMWFVALLFILVSWWKNEFWALVVYLLLYGSMSGCHGFVVCVGLWPHDVSRNHFGAWSQWWLGVVATAWPHVDHAHTLIYMKKHEKTAHTCRCSQKTHTHTQTVQFQSGTYGMRMYKNTYSQRRTNSHNFTCSSDGL